ncbi:hypothetical protein C6A86_016960 [Mycobacterium sp. ITM-2016-00316]|uniref:hypothetical protein n=1 Tax=Mycobacterium sp. ITM-2016-00316 TaxID=2099695 RepID=UPI001159AB89|nr:hypothetical protein [Mycobacterium sp. ITM-2016-00316]WNG79956.1 hypothetical protein C6A86_016960 [Mycobacterium sp. ITM-2016-00316]
MTPADVRRRWNEMGGRCGRNKLPEIVWRLYEDDAFTVGECNGYRIFDTELLAVAVQDAWSSAEYSEGALDGFFWVELFGSAYPHLTFPSASITLYRGVRDAEWARRMSWTSSLESVRWFANRYECTGTVYRIVDVDPQDVLAQIAEGRDEDEFVLYPEYLDDAPVQVMCSNAQCRSTVDREALDDHAVDSEGHCWHSLNLVESVVG